MTKREIQKHENMLVEQSWETAKQVYQRYDRLLEEKQRQQSISASSDVSLVTFQNTHGGRRFNYDT